MLAAPTAFCTLPASNSIYNRCRSPNAKKAIVRPRESEQREQSALHLHTNHEVERKRRRHHRWLERTIITSRKNGRPMKGSSTKNVNRSTLVVRGGRCSEDAPRCALSVLCVLQTAFTLLDNVCFDSQTSYKALLIICARCARSPSSAAFDEHRAPFGDVCRRLARFLQQLFRRILPIHD